MKLQMPMLVLLASALLAVAGYGQNPPAAVPLQTKTELAQITARLEKDLPSLLKEADVPGLSIALIRDGKLVWQHAFGVKKCQDPRTRH
jgi:CubicO group peptidase (beta-lactamase class C family)